MLGWKYWENIVKGDVIFSWSRCQILWRLWLSPDATIGALDAASVQTL